MKQTVNKHIKVAIVSILAVASLGTALLYKNSVAYAADCPPGQEQKYVGSTLTCVKISEPQTSANPNATPTTGSTSPLGDFKASPDPGKVLEAKNTKICGSGDGNEVKVAFDFGCAGPDYCKNKSNSCSLNPIVDIAFAIFRFLSVGVGLIVIGSIIVAGIQYSASRGNPQATQASIKRITSALIGLVVYIFMFTILNYLVPGGMFI
ncbi:hypothetical protein EBQ81_00465 [bacterium]|nr:hypothetical protein [bacterium]